ncbi:MAG: 8-oxo-dGTP pyrophosphatase MutT (NUDIX family) [Algoriphagus sp.]|jgi:8-oxo-dGTP pyrophosphatase MutT (NUDIX family)
MNRKQLTEQLSQYKAFNDIEEGMRIRMLAFVEKHEDCFERSLLIGHVTASCWVVNASRDKVLLIDHVKLKKWLQPGGHCDGDQNTLRVALKELQEETGIVPTDVSLDIFDIDIHLIPKTKSIPEHEHFDLRYLFVADLKEKIIQNHETNAIKWIRLQNLERMTREESILRMKSKTRATQ